MAVQSINIQDRTVSHYKRIFSDHTPSEITLPQLAKIITDPARKDQLRAIRTLKATDRKAYDAAKKKLPLFTASATFFDGKGKKNGSKMDTGRKLDNLKHYNGLIQLDFDDLTPEAVHQHREALEQQPFVVMVFESIGASGIKAIALTDNTNPEDHYRYYWSLLKHFRKLGMELDRSCSDYTRAFFIPYSDFLYTNWTATPFNTPITQKELEHLSKTKKTSTKKQNINSADSSTVSRPPSTVQPQTLSTVANLDNGSNTTVHAHSPDSEKFALALHICQKDPRFSLADGERHRSIRLYLGIMCANMGIDKNSAISFINQHTDHLSRCTRCIDNAYDTATFNSFDWNQAPTGRHTPAQGANPVNPKMDFDKKETILQYIATKYANAIHEKGNANAYNKLYKTHKINPETIKHFGIGYDDNTIHTLLKTDGLDLQAATELGILDKNGTPRLKERIIYPITDQEGKIKGFAAQSIFSPEHRAKHDIPLYLYTTPIKGFFQRENLMFGYSQASNHIKQSNEAIIATSYTETMLAHQHHIPNTICTINTPIADIQVEKLTKLTENITIAAPITTATLTNFEELMKKFLDRKSLIKIFQLPPDRTLQSHLQTEHSIPDRIDAILQYAELKTAFTENLPFERNRALDQITNIISYIPQRDTRNLYLKTLAKKIKNATQDELERKLKRVLDIRETEKQGKAKIKAASPSDAKNYIRVGTTYYKKVLNYSKKLGQTELQLVKWKIEAIKHDYEQKAGIKKFTHLIKSYDNFAVAPDFKNPQEVIHIQDKTLGVTSKLYNLCRPLSHTPKPGEFPTIQKLLIHLFGRDEAGNIVSQWNHQAIGDPLTMIKDCYRLKLQIPTHILPIPCIVSHEQETGKSTILKFNKYLLGGNATVIGNQHLEDRFNASYADKLIVGVDETALDLEKRTIKEKIKRMTTDDKIHLERKGVDTEELDWYGWLWFASNNEYDFLKMEESDKRFWIIKAHPITEKDPAFNQKLIEEIPAFLHWALNTPIFHPEKTRIWFDDQLIITDQMREVIEETRGLLDKSIINLVRETFELYNIASFKMPLDKLTEQLNEGSKYKHDKERIRSWLYRHKGMKPTRKAMRCKFPLYYDDMGPEREASEPTHDMIVWYTRTGKPYIFKIEDWFTKHEIETLFEADDAYMRYNEKINVDEIF